MGISQPVSGLYGRDDHWRTGSAGLRRARRVERPDRHTLLWGLGVDRRRGRTRL